MAAADPPSQPSAAAWKPDFTPVSGGNVLPGADSPDAEDAMPEKTGFTQRCLDIFSFFDRRGVCCERGSCA